MGAERGREVLYPHPHHRECESYDFPKLTDKEEKGDFKQVIYDGKKDITHEFKIEYKADRANVWEVPHLDSRIEAHYHDIKDQGERVLILVQRYDKDSDDKDARVRVRFLTNRRHPSDRAYEVF